MPFIIGIVLLAKGRYFHGTATFILSIVVPIVAFFVWLGASLWRRSSG